MADDDQLTAAWDSAEYNARRAERAEAEVRRLKQAVEDWHDRAVTAERALTSLQDRYEQVANERESLSDTLQAIIDRVQGLQPVVLAAMAAHKPPNAKISGDRQAGRPSE